MPKSRISPAKINATPTLTAQRDQEVTDILAKAGPEIDRIIRTALDCQRNEPDRAEERVLALIRNTVNNTVKNSTDTNEDEV